MLDAAEGFVPGSRVQVSAHAGDRSPTLETYRNAVATGADYVELDIRRTADGALVSFHDARTSRGEPLAAALSLYPGPGEPVLGRDPVRAAGAQPGQRPQLGQPGPQPLRS